MDRALRFPVLLGFVLFFVVVFVWFLLLLLFVYLFICLFVWGLLLVFDFVGFLVFCCWWCCLFVVVALGGGGGGGSEVKTFVNSLRSTQY